MGRKVKKQGGLRRVAAVLMAVAMVLSVMPVEPGVFSITVNAAEKLSAVWTTADSVLKDTNNTEADSVKGGTLTTNNGNVIDISDANTFTKRTSNGDFLVNGGVELSLPVVSKAKTCTITLVSYNDITSDSHSITVDGMKDTSISKSGSGWLTYTITGTPDGSGNTVTIKTNSQEYFRSIEVNSSSSLAVTDAAFADGHMSAEWTYNNGIISAANNSTSSIQSTTGTYTNESGDVLYVAAETGKFQPDSTTNKRIQINKSTKLTLPVIGDKAVMTIVVNKNGIGSDKDNVLTEQYLALTGTGLLRAECTSVKTYQDDGNYKVATIECYLDGEEGELTLEVLSNTYFRSIGIACEEVSTTTISGSVTSKSDIPEGTQVVATNKTTGLTYKSDINDGKYSIEVPVEDTQMEYELTLSNPEYQITSDITTCTVSTADTEGKTIDLTVIKLSTCIVTGNINGIADNYDISNMKLVFDTDEATDYEPEITVDKDNKTYSAKLEKGLAYKLSVQGINDYEITSDVTGLVYTQDSTLDINLGLKSVYTVTVKLPDEPDLTNAELTYIYTNNEDGYVYQFNSAEDIRLRNGSYTLKLAGDFLAQPYSIKSGADVTVNGNEVSQTLGFELVTEWSFVYSDDGNYYKDTINGTTGYYNGLYIDATSGKLTPNGSTPNSAQFNTGAKISVPVTGKCTISVEAYDKTYALYTIGGTAADTTQAVSTYQYTDKNAGTVDIVSTGNAYIKSIKVVYAAKDVEYKEQAEMPQVYTYGNADSLVVQPEGQRLVLTQTGGSLGTTTNADKTTNINTSVSFYGFNETSDINKLTADIIIEDCGNSSSNGIFFGAFNKDYIVTTGIRKGSELKMIYSKSESDLTGASGGVTGNYPVGTVVTFTVEKSDTELIITATPKGGQTQTAKFDYSKNLLFKKNGKNTAVSYGFVLAGVKAVVKNMTYTSADGKVLYDQNDCYQAAGVAPVVKSVKAKAAATRDYIDVSWENETEAQLDGMYALQVSTDKGNTWTDVDTAITEKSYRYNISEAGDYQFRVCGKLGVNGDRNTYAVSDNINVIAALDSVVLNISSTADKVNLTWDTVNKATEYDIYRYSYDDTQDNAKKIATVNKCEYEDSDVAAEMPYYYYAVANSYVNGVLDNWSNPSETVWTVPSAGHTSDYVYEDEAVGFTITKRSYNTVYDGKLTIEGVVEKQANVTLKINGTEAGNTDAAAKGTFSFEDKQLSAGRNNVELLFTDKNGKVTRETFNYVYLTDYQKVVDAKFTGNDGDKVNGIETYKTVQAAVDSVSSANSERVIILVKEGDYEEHLIVSSPYITLIGEDSEKTRIFYDTKEWVGGDMGLRCAVKINATATGFSAENLTIENTYKYLGNGTISNESCDALRNDAANASYINVRILGYQDTLCANGGTQYYYKCYIAGNVDFIYGNEPRALFNDCKLVFRYNANKNSGYVCAPKTGASAAYGLTFNNCQVISEEGCSGSKYYLARPWGQDAYITWINCYMGKMIRANSANPYSDMSGALASKARFYEFGSFGPGYAINVNRRQISKSKADSMITASYLGWDPYSAVTDIGTEYIGNISTQTDNKYVEKEYVSDTYSENEGNDKGLDAYTQEGYAQSANTTGGGLLKESSKNYYTVDNAEDFLKAIQSVKKSGMASVIELTADIALGDKEVNNFQDYSAFITAHKQAPLTHPTLLKTGVSMLKLENMSNLTIYSKKGAKITHTCVDITGSNNIIIRNIEFDEIWEWDDETQGGYDRNDWDYMTIEKGSFDIWIDHCTFYKAYDGVIDIKTPTDSSNVTISWCEFLPSSEDNVFFDAMMNIMKDNPDNYPYYKHLLEEGMTDRQIYNYAYGQKKTHLLGQSDTDTSAKNITATFANNYYKNSMDRMPRLRYGTAHVYNCIMDAQDLRDMRLDIENTVGSTLAQKIVSNGASSNCGAHMLLENCYMSGMTNVLISGNGESSAGYINAVNTIYKLDNKAADLKVMLNTSKEGEVALVQDKDEFKAALPYSDYRLYSASELSTVVQPYTGAGKLTLTTLQWEKTKYNDEHTVHTEHKWDEGVVTKEATCTEAGEKTYTCTVCNATRTEKIEATGHKYSTEWTIDKEATCTESGSKSHHCTVCNAKTEETEIKATGHKWDEGKVTKEATCTEAGEKTYTCTVCKETKTEKIDAAGHKYSTEWTIDKEATCTESGSKSHHCTVCNAKTEETEIKATGHKWDEGKVTKEATCTEAGEKTYTCTVCKETKTEEIKATGHKYSTEWTIDKEATYTEPGSKSHHCTVCGARTDITEIPVIKENKDDNVKTDVTVSQGKDAPDTTFDESDEELTDKILTEDEKIQAAGKDIKINLSINNISDNASDEDIKLIKNRLTVSQKVGMILDIKLNMTIGADSKQVYETAQEITLSAEIPEELLNNNSDIIRKYSVIRIHDSKAEILKSEYNAQTKKITFKTDRFSTYAIIYEDTKKDNTQETTKPAGGNTQETTKPTGGNTQETTKPAGGNTQETTKPAGGNTQEITKPAGGNTQETTKPTGDNTILSTDITNSSIQPTATENINSQENQTITASDSDVNTGDSISAGKAVAIIMMMMSCILAMCVVILKKKNRNI